ncbi:hypothetical protein LUQ84_002743 [Hamiltosporidium tvaerminnensis]|nr:hypothetical protein LUQ84_002743 [Hamiltosporidium tvaerminnensis]
MSKKKYHHHPKADSSSFLSDHTNNTQDNIFQKSRAGKNVLPSVIEKAHLKKGKDVDWIETEDTSLTKYHNANVVNEMTDATDKRTRILIPQHSMRQHRLHTLTIRSLAAEIKPQVRYFQDSESEFIYVQSRNRTRSEVVRTWQSNRKVSL